MKSMRRLIVMLGAFCFAVTLQAETRVTYKSAKSTSSYYQMAVQIAEAMKMGSDGAIIVTVEESQGSVQNVKEVGNRGGNYVFTTPPVLVKLAKGGRKMFKDANPRYQNIRSLFVIPSLTMHLVVRANAGIEKFADLAGKKFLIGKGSFGAREAAKYIEIFGLKGKVDLIDVELNAAVAALKNGQIDGFATAGSYPAPNVIEAAAGTPLRVISLSDDQVTQTKRTRLVIPAGTYPGVDQPVVTTSLPVGAYSTTEMDDNLAYQLTRTFWEQKSSMGKNNAWWNPVTVEGLSSLGAKLHPGALRYYREAGVSVPQHLE
ncbi:MAG: TAXI family TRAP transporter solute-binding subunit [Gammaproteobacteria bacterium]|nr:TAXI family TRAP transporter solute-binding subunit [Gammaproteobacteria bacterium]